MCFCSKCGRYHNGMGAKISCLLRHTTKEADGEWDKAFAMMQRIKSKQPALYELLQKNIEANAQSFKKFWS